MKSHLKKEKDIKAITVIKIYKRLCQTQHDTAAASLQDPCPPILVYKVLVHQF